MIVAVSVCELHLPGAQSLKDKRRVVKSLVERVHKRFRISIAETDFHDLHQRAELGLAAVAQSEHEARELMAKTRDLFDAEFEAVVSSWTLDFIEGA